jgi:hypothetical protein
MKHSVLYVSVFIIGIHYAASQETMMDSVSSTLAGERTPGLYKNAIYVTGGVAMGTFIAGNYERMLWGNRHPVVQSVYLRGGVGKVNLEAFGFFYTDKLKATTYMAAGGLLVGGRSSFFDLSMGAVYLNGTETWESIFSSTTVRTETIQQITFAISTGYRYQKPGGNFVFRVGAGWPELLYISLGISF